MQMYKAVVFKFKMAICSSFTQDNQEKNGKLFFLMVRFHKFIMLFKIAINEYLSAFVFYKLNY